MEDSLCRRTPSLPYKDSVSRPRCLTLFVSCSWVWMPDSPHTQFPVNALHPHDNYVLYSSYMIGPCFQTQIRWRPRSCPHPMYSPHPEIKMSCLTEVDTQKAISIVLTSWPTPAQCLCSLCPIAWSPTDQEEMGDPTKYHWWSRKNRKRIRLRLFK